MRLSRKKYIGWSALMVWILAFGPSPKGSAQSDDAYERPPIRYSATTPNDEVQRLERRIGDGEIQLAGAERELLRSLLRGLDVPESSQVLVFSKTSLQRTLIQPHNPRALYFSDTCYVGWVPGGLMEVTCIDPVLGPVFYSFDPETVATGHPRFNRDADCLRCHGGNFIRDIPSVFVRSVPTDSSGDPLLALGSVLVDATTPFADRWGGWYVTGYKGPVRHRGNIFSREKNGMGVVDADLGVEPVRLANYADPGRYLRGTSDATTLMIFEHQCAMQNALTRAGHQARRMLSYQEGLQRELGEKVTDEPVYESVRRVFDSVTKDVLDNLLFKDEAALPAGGLDGDAEFIVAFSKNAPRAADGRSLKDLQLLKRLFKYRCSYLIYSPAFKELPRPLKSRIYERLGQVLMQPESDARYAYMSASERLAIREILRDTLPDLPSSWGR